jgi:NhaA family Na+:H+ antiporter
VGAAGHGGSRRRALAEFLHDESAGGEVLLVAAVAALLWANLAAEGAYESFWGRELTLGIGDLSITEDLQHWINDGLMALFFFVVGLEIKRELVVGELRERRAALMPAMAALGGVLLPVAIFLALIAGAAGASGWAIPAATDIAFAVGVLALLGDRVAPGARLFLLSIAIVDDLIAIAIIAAVYAEGIEIGWLAAAAAALGAVAGARRLGVNRIAAYVALGVAAWIAMYESGVHATVAGVALGLLTPARPVDGRPVLETLERRLHPVSAFAVVPLFALANAGVDLGGGVLGDALRSRLAWAIAVGLVAGKALGIGGATFLGLRRGWGALPRPVPPRQIWGVATLGGIGFTVSLFIADLAYDEPSLVDSAKVGIFAGSIVSAAAGATVLVLAGRVRPPRRS